MIWRHDLMLIGEKILKLSSEKEAKIDSTPLKASRYDENADYHPHYGCQISTSPTGSRNHLGMMKL